MVTIGRTPTLAGGATRPASLVQRALFGVLLPLMFIVGGGGFALVGLMPIVERFNSRHWHSTQAIIDSARLDGGSGPPIAPRAPGQPVPAAARLHTNQKPVISYRYTVNTIERTGTRFRHGDFFFLTRDEAIAFASQHIPGRSVTVYYDPADPGRAVLQRSHSRDAWIFLGFGAPVALLGVVIALAINAPRRARA